jgi:hypothetical protein
VLSHARPEVRWSGFGEAVLLQVLKGGDPIQLAECQGASSITRSYR